MLTLDKVSIRYGHPVHGFTAAEEISLSIPAGQTLGLVGESGSGKSTIARAIVGLVPIVAGTVRVDGRDVTSTRARNTAEFRRTVQMVFQDPFASLNPRMTVREAILEAVALRPNLSRTQREAELRRVLDMVGISATADDRYPHQFSGGQRQRIAIARALAINPKVLIMDEVTSALDVSVQAAILNLLNEIQRELGLSYLFISHDLSVVAAMSQQVAVMYVGRLVELRAATDLFQSPGHPYSQALLQAVPRFGTPRSPAPIEGNIPDPANPPAGCRFHTRCPAGPLRMPGREICALQDPQGLLQPGGPPACHFPIGAPAVAGLSNSLEK